MVIALGEPKYVGGNIAQLTSNGKVRITNSKGKTKDISAKSFQKQIQKNADKIQNGDSFEFKSGSTAKKIAKGIGILGAAAGVAAAVIFRKDIGKFVQNTDFKKCGENLISKGTEMVAESLKSAKKLSGELLEKGKKFGSENLMNFKNDLNEFFSENNIDIKGKYKNCKSNFENLFGSK